MYTTDSCTVVTKGFTVLYSEVWQFQKVCYTIPASQIFKLWHDAALYWDNQMKDILIQNSVYNQKPVSSKQNIGQF